MENLKRLFEKYTGREAEEVTELSSSGSNRRYFRLRGGKVSIVGVSGTSLDENKAFINLSRHFVDKGIRVPKVLGVSEDGMSYIQEDLGDDQLFSVISHGRDSGEYSSMEKDLLAKTIEMLPKIQFKGAEGLDWSVCWPESSFGERMVMFRPQLFQILFFEGDWA